MAKAAKKRTVTCGKCGNQGHNARSCKPAKKEIKSSKDIPPPPKNPGTKTRVDERFEQTERRMSTVPKRDAPTADTGAAATAAPFRCPKCNAVAILVIVRVVDHMLSHKKEKTIYAGETRCEKCMNKPNPSDLILKWGARPGEKIETDEIPGNDA